MLEPDRHLTILSDGEVFAPDSRFRLSGTMRIGLFPSLFLLQCWNLADEDIFRLQNTKPEPGNEAGGAGNPAGPAAAGV